MARVYMTHGMPRPLPAVPASTVGRLPSFATSVGSGRYILDQYGQPWLMVGDSSWNLVLNVSSSDANFLLQTRAGQGFNSNNLTLVGGTYENAQSTWATFDGVVPFYQSDGVTLGTGPANYDVTQPNLAYWTRVDSVVQAAKTYGITLWLVPLATAAYQDNTSFYSGQGQTKLNKFATWVAARYNPYGNVQWLMGDDYWPSLQSANNSYLVGMAQSIVAAASPAPFISCEANGGIWFQSHTAGLDLTTDIAIFTNGTPSGSQVNGGINTVYDPRPGGPGTTNSSPDFYRAYNLVPALPLIFGEGNYENSTGGKGPTTAALSQLMCRSYAYCSMLCGACGWIYGDSTVWYNGSGWKSLLSEPGQAGNTIAASLFQSYQWWRLVPDQTAAFVTSVNSAAPSAWASGPVIGVTSAGGTGAYGGAAAVTALGDLGLVYCFQNDTVTVAMTAMRGSTTARWWDPTNGTYTSIGTFANTGTHTFSNTGTNNNSQSDWVLVLTA